MFVRDIPARKGNAVVSVTPETTVSRVVGIMREGGVGSVLVSLEGDTLVGVPFEPDVMAKPPGEHRRRSRTSGANRPRALAASRTNAKTD